MCGIIGIVSARPQSEIRDALARGTRSMAHRGPDDEGLEFLTAESDPLTVAFGHRRLSILDLSPAGHQPMRDEATGNWITYNGEVFNFKEIRPALEQQQVQFRSDSDTEVLLKGFGVKGLDAVTDWRGMFALGLWEPSPRRLTLIRDRLGIKPVYYYYDGKTFAFASEVKALLKTGLVPRTISRPALKSYLAYGSVQQPLTIIENVHALLPGHWLRFENGEIKTGQYWDLTATCNTRQVKDEETLVGEVRELLQESVRLRMVADVPVGAFLSGGIDSSAIVSLMRHSTNGSIKTFSVCFDEQEYSEQAFANAVAEKFGTEHYPVLVCESDILKKLPRILESMDQPSVDGINSYIVSEATADAGLKVALSGLGGDEVFAGYSHFRTIGRNEQIRKKVSRIPLSMRQMAAATVSTFASSNRATKLAGLLNSSELNLHSLLLHRQLFTEPQRKALVGNGTPNQTDTYTAHLLSTVSDLSDDSINQASVLDLATYLSNTLLRDTDVMSMAHSLEVRVPLLDHRLVEYLLSLRGNVKIDEKTPKWLLVKGAGDLPNEIVYRRKQGFEFPFATWLRNDLASQINEMLASQKLAEFIKINYANNLWHDFNRGHVSWTRIWSLFTLFCWMESL